MSGRSSGPAGSLALAVALRYLRSTRRDAFVSFLSASAAVGIALGTAALILALAALSGFQDALRREVLARTPEIEIRLPPGADAAAAVRTLEAQRGVESVQRLLEARGWLVAEGRARPADVVGFDGELPGFFPEASGRKAGFYLSDELAEHWGLEPGDTVELASSRPTLTPLGPAPRTRRLQLAGTFAAGRTELRDRVALPYTAAVGLFGESGARLVVGAGGLSRALALAETLAEVLPPGSRIRTWRELNRALFFALRLEKSVMFVAVLLIVCVAVLSLVSGLMLILAGKRHEIGMLRAMGAPAATVRRAFVWLAALLAGSGLALGAAVGLVASWVLDRWQLVRLPERVYFLDHVPFDVRPGDLALILVACGGLAVLSAAVAANRAAALRPVEALRR